MDNNNAKQVTLSQVAKLMANSKRIALPGVHAKPPQIPGERLMHKMIAHKLGIR